MSIVHNIINKRPLDFSRLNSFVSTIDGAMYENRGENAFYYWIDRKSTRGLNITIEKDSIEVRNTVLSNADDYELTNKIVTKILLETDGIIFGEEGEQITNFPIFDDRKIRETEIRDCEVVQTLMKERVVSIDGTNRKVHFGEHLYQHFKSFKREKLKNEMFDLILKVNYRIPNFEVGNIMLVGNSEDDDNPKRMKVLSNDTDKIIDKYDYIVFPTSSEQLIMITNEILNSILPPNWVLVDEYTIVAPVLEQSEWEKLLINAKKYDLWETFINGKENASR